MAEATKKEADVPAKDQAAAETAAAEADAKAAAETAAAAAEADAKAGKETTKSTTGARGRAKPKGRMETFDAVRPDGKTVTIVRNIDTGEQSAEVKE